MTNRALKKFCNSLHKDLSIAPKGSCFIIKENGDDSAIKEIHFTFKNKDDVVLIKQDEKKHTIDMFLQYHTNCSCDFILFVNDKKDLHICLCEIKSSLEYIEKAKEQLKSSKLFLQYLLNCYVHYSNDKEFAKIDLDSIKMYYIYPKLGISNKKSVCPSDNEGLIFKPIAVGEKNCKIDNAYEFFIKE